MNLLRSNAMVLFILALAFSPDSQPARPPRHPSVAASQNGGVAGDPRAAARPVVAVARMPAPSNSTDIRITLTNLSGQSPEGPQEMLAVILDCHRALGGRALTVDSVAITIPPPGGTATVTTGNDPDDVGPAVITFTGFEFRESVEFTVDLDTWEDPNFVEIRAHLAACRVEVVFAVPALAVAPVRGDGTMRVRGDDSVEATIRQRSP